MYVLPLVLWIINLEVNPGLQNIWLRSNSNGTKSFTLQNVFNLILYPFRNREMWKPKFWDVNLYTFYASCILFFMFVDNLLGLLETRDKRWEEFYVKMMHL